MARTPHYVELEPDTPEERLHAAAIRKYPVIERFFEAVSVKTKRPTDSEKGTFYKYLRGEAPMPIDRWPVYAQLLGGDPKQWQRPATAATLTAEERKERRNLTNRITALEKGQSELRQLIQAEAQDLRTSFAELQKANRRQTGGKR